MSDRQDNYGPFWFGTIFGAAVGLSLAFVLSNTKHEIPTWPVDHALYLKRYDECIDKLRFKSEYTNYIIENCEAIATKQARVRPQVEPTK